MEHHPRRDHDAREGDDDTTCTSNLIAQFDANYGAGNWQAEIQAVWDNWTSLTGNVYTPAVPLDPDGTPIDDGAVWPDTRGVANVRGDIRIGGCDIDGDSNTLAYNFFPNTGDMKIDATDVFFQTTNLTTAFHNVFSHEHGHGVGLDHVCPINGTKLMEPVINLGFRGLQHDDIRGVQRGYGDRFEVINNPNDTAGAATPLTLEPAQSEQQLSLDSTGDVDWFTFDANVRDTLTVSVIPNGLVYPEGPDPGLCSGGPGSVSSLDSRAIQDLSFEIRDATGVVTTVDSTGAGAAESISDFVIPATGTYFVRVLGTGTDDAQLYDLSVRKDPAPPDGLRRRPAPYPTRFADDGARHGDEGVLLGATVDALEPDGLPSPDALGDDERDSDDEDGVDFTSPVQVGETADVEVTLTGPASPMDAWIDFNRDGDWTDPGEQIFAARVIQTGANDLTFAVPPSACRNDLRSLPGQLGRRALPIGAGAGRRGRGPSDRHRRRSRRADWRHRNRRRHRRRRGVDGTASDGGSPITGTPWSPLRAAPCAPRPPRPTAASAGSPTAPPTPSRRHRRQRHRHRPVLGAIDPSNTQPPPGLTDRGRCGPGQHHGNRFLDRTCVERRLAHHRLRGDRRARRRHLHDDHHRLHHRRPHQRHDLHRHRHGHECARRRSRIRAITTRDPAYGAHRSRRSDRRPGQRQHRRRVGCTSIRWRLAR